MVDQWSGNYHVVESEGISLKGRIPAYSFALRWWDYFLPASF